MQITYRHNGEATGYAYFAVFDGHSAKDYGTEASQFSSKHCHFEIMREIADNGDQQTLETCVKEGFVTTNNKFCEVNCIYDFFHSSNFALMCVGHVI